MTAAHVAHDKESTPMSFDPEELFNRLRDVFNRAAEADSGTAQPLFQKLADKVDRLYKQATDPANQNLDRQKMMFKMAPLIMDLQLTMKQIEAEVKRNPQAAEVLAQLSSDMQQELKALMGNIPGLPGLPKLPGMDFGQPREPKAPPAPPAPKRDTPPRKPGGKFKF
jgi:hypothetical protein